MTADFSVSGSSLEVEGGPPDPSGATTAGRGARWMETEARRRRGRRAPADASPSFDGGHYSEAALKRARHLWTVRATAEQESAFVFTGLLPFALEAGARLPWESDSLKLREE